MLGMFALGVSFLYGVAVAAAVAVAFTVVAALTLLPALLVACSSARLVPRRRRAPRAPRGRRSPRATSRPLWARWTGVAAAGARRCSPPLAAIVMIVIAIPFFSMRLGSADAGTDPSGTTTRKAYDLLAKGFGPGYNGPLELVAKVDNAAQLKRASTAPRRGRQETATSSPPRPLLFLPGTRRPSVCRDRQRLSRRARRRPPRPPTCSNASATTIDPRRRRAAAASTVLVGGTTAIFEDFSHVCSQQAAAVHRDRRRCSVPAADGGVPQPR